MVDVSKYKTKNESKHVFCKAQAHKHVIEMQLAPPDIPLFSSHSITPKSQ